jgi:hypothetical protein
LAAVKKIAFSRQNLWESTRIEAERKIQERIEANPGIRQCDLYEGYEEFTNWLAPMLAEWTRKRMIRRIKDGRTYKVFPVDNQLKKASA